MDIKFTKMHALGNDFMVVNRISQSFPCDREHIIAWSDRHRGIGFDQLLVVEPSASLDADFFYRIFNADGSEVAQCGNGARALAKFIQDEKLSSKNILRLKTHQALIEVSLENEKRMTVNLGIPKFLAQEIPTTLPKKGSLYVLEDEKESHSFFLVNIGNPHAVIFVPSLEGLDIEKSGHLFSTHSEFKEGINVEFVQIINSRTLAMRVYERGVGETSSCGSGACAAMIASKLHNQMENEVEVILPGGVLQVKWQGLGYPVYLSGEITTVFIGTVSI